MSDVADPELQQLATVVASALRVRARDLVEEWIDWLEHRVRTRTIASLPRRELRNHIPPVVALLAQFIETPIEVVREEMLGHLRIHAQVRRDQGYDLQELLTEFDGLAHRLADCLYDTLDAAPEPASMRHTFVLMERLSSGVRSIAFVTVGLYQEGQSYMRRELARRLEQFGRTIGHELASPLNTIALGVQLISEVSLEQAELQKHCGVMENAVRRARDLLEDIRILAVAESAAVAGDLVSLGTAVQLVLDELRSAADQRQVRLEISGSLPDCEVDSASVKLTLINLLSNAVKYSDVNKPQRWVRISASLSEPEDEGALCTLIVEDNGVGIPKGMVDRVFQRNVRAHPEIAEGTGLGLAITRQTVLERGGSITLSSDEGSGTRVELTVRAISAPQGAVESGKLLPSEIARRMVVDLAKKRS